MGAKEKVWAKLAEDPHFREHVETQTHEEWRKFCKTLCFLSTLHFKHQLDGRILLSVRRDVVLEMLNGWVYRLYPPDQAEAKLLFYQAEFKRLCTQLDTTSRSPGWEPLSDELFIAEEEEENGISLAALERWREGDLTVRDLLLTQPSALIALG